MTVSLTFRYYALTVSSTTQVFDSILRILFFFFFSDWLEASRAFAILGMLAGLTAILSAVIVFVLGLMDKDSLGGPVSVKILGIATLAMAGASREWYRVSW